MKTCIEIQDAVVVTFMLLCLVSVHIIAYVY